MSCTIIYWDNLLDDCVLTASTEVTAYEVENLQNIHRVQTWRTTGITSENVVIDAGLGNTIAPASLLISYHNLTSSATVTLQGNATDSWGAPSFSQALTLDYNADTIIVEVTGASTAYRYWRIVIADTTNTDTYLEIGRIFIGDGLEVDKSASDSFSEVYKSTTVTQFSFSGQPFSDVGVTYREYDLFFPYWDSDMKDDIHEMFQAVGAHTPVFLTIDKYNTDKLTCVYGVFTGDEVYNYLHNYAWSSSITIREVF